MGVFGVVFGCIGVVGFNGCCSGASIGDGGFTLACISGCRGVIGFKVPMGGVLSAKKFALRRCVIVKARKSSPCALKTPQNRRFMACWASFFAEEPLERSCWASFFAEMRLEVLCWANLFAEEALERPCWASFFADRQSWDPAGLVVLRRGPGSRPFDWQC